ncbi:MAG TPA: FGGY family carbohydrate kinase, partial [Prevotella sp.]
MTKQLKYQQANRTFFAVDLGATSGRTVIGTISDHHADGSATSKPTIMLEELTRFDNTLIPLHGHIYWDLFALYNKIIESLRLAAQRKQPIESIGIDTWGSDFVCIGADGLPLRNPIAYRDPHTVGKMEAFFKEVMPKEQVYERTGIQFMNLNSLFQLYAMHQAEDSALQHADKILFIPDALSYLLTGQMVCEYSIASTSQMLNVHTKDIDNELIAGYQLRREQFGKMVQPGTVIGVLTKEVQKQTGLGAIPVVAVAGHDTASAVA